MNTIKFYGSLKNKIGNDVIELKLGNFTIHEIKDKLQKDFNLDDFNILMSIYFLNGYILLNEK